MVRRVQELGLALSLAAFCLPAVAQSTPSKVAPVAATTSAGPSKPHAHRKKVAPDPPPQQAPAPPPTLEQSPPTPPHVSNNNGQLTIIAQNATLSQVLRSVQSLTGASVEMPSSASSERVVGQFGPGEPRDVLNTLLNGTKFNYIILGVNGNPGGVQRVILTTARPASTATAQNNGGQPTEEPQDEESYNEPEPQPAPPQPIPPQFRHRPNVPGRVPEGFAQQQPPPPQQAIPIPDNAPDNAQPGAKTPEQLLQELQQMQQQQQQMQDQLNPANRQPPPQ